MNDIHTQNASSSPVNIRMEPSPNCVACGTPGLPLFQGLKDRLYAIPGVWNISNCPNCGHLWQNPRPIDSDIALCYPTRYFTHAKVSAPPKVTFLGWRGMMKRWMLQGLHGYPLGSSRLSIIAGKLLGLIPPIHSRLIQSLGPLILPWRPDGKLLDIGCGNGRYIKMMESLGWNVAGIEMDDAAAKTGRDNWNLNIFTGQAADAPFPQSSFDYVTASHLLEHLSNPIEYLATMIGFLKPGGKIIILTPNADSLTLKLFKNNCFLLQPPQHLHLFGNTSVRILLNKIPSLGNILVKTNPRMARRAFLLSHEIDSTNRTIRLEPTFFKHSIAWRIAAILFGAVESIGNAIAVWGEELEVSAVRER